MENVQFKGQVSDDELSWIYSNSSIFAMPSSQEGFGLVYLEAMWHGLPCIVSDIDGGRFVVGKECGLVVEYENAAATAQAVISMLSDPSVVHRMGEAAKRRALSKFSYAAFSARLKKALNLDSAEAETSS
jgi:glycosyltransferase involved in cell wall biosynthesis